MEKKYLQDEYAGRAICFGCGPANKNGLRIKSYPEGDTVVCLWQAEKHHEAFDGHLNGGIIGTLLDCHCNWTGVWHFMEKYGHEEPPCTVTAEYSIKMTRPTPTDRPIRLVGRVLESTERKVRVEGDLIAHDEICATFNGLFVIVKPGHPAFHRW